MRFCCVFAAFLLRFCRVFAAFLPRVAAFCCVVLFYSFGTLTESHGCIWIQYVLLSQCHFDTQLIIIQLTESSNSIIIHMSVGHLRLQQGCTSYTGDPPPSLTSPLPNTPPKYTHRHIDTSVSSGMNTGKAQFCSQRKS